MSTQNYTYAEHRFRFAAWAAGRAIQRGFSFTNEEAPPIFEKIGFDKIAGKDHWLLEIDDFDAQHAIWRDEVYKDLEGKKDRSHGRAAKLINVFIKTLMPSDMYSISPELRERWDKVHPPIDRILLTNLDKEKFGDKEDWGKVPWTQLKRGQYQKLIDNMRLYEPCLWKIERFWKLGSDQKST